MKEQQLNTQAALPNRGTAQAQPFHLLHSNNSALMRVLKQKPQLEDGCRDAIIFFASGAGKGNDIIFCNLARPGLPATPSLDSAVSPASMMYMGDRYDPYDLIAVPQTAAHQQLHFIVSYKGVVTVSSGGSTEITPHAEWLRQAELFAAFQTWRSNALQQRFRTRQARLGSLLLTQQEGVAAALQAAHQLILEHLSTSPTPHQDVAGKSRPAISDRCTKCSSPAAAPPDLTGMQLLDLLCGWLRSEAVLSLSDLADWQLRAQTAVAEALNRLQVKLLDCLVNLEHHLTRRMAHAQQAAAAAAERPSVFDADARHREVAAVLCRVTSVIDTLVTSHAALLVTTATAMLSEVLQPPGKVHFNKTLRLEDQHGLLHPQLLDEQPEAKPSVQFKVQAEIMAASELLQEWKEKAPDTAVGNLRFTPTCDQLCSAIRELPAAFAAIINSLPQLCNEPAVRAWQLNASASCCVAAGTAPPAQSKGSAQERGNAAQQGKSRPGTAAVVDESGSAALTKSELNMLRARNTRLEVLLSGNLETQDAVAAIVQQHYIATVNSQQLQPFCNAAPLVLLCCNFNPEQYLAAHSSARNLKADITAVHGWLTALASSNLCSLSCTPLQDCPRHSRSCGGRNDEGAALGSWSGSGSGGGSSSACGSKAPAASSCDASFADRSGPGLVVLELGSARSALLKMASATLGALYGILHPAYMQHCQGLLACLNKEIALLGQLPSQLDPFIVWLPAVNRHFPSAAAAFLESQEAHPAASRCSSQPSADQVDLGKAALLGEFEALRLLLGAMRGQTASEGTARAPASGVVSAYRQPGSPVHNALEAATTVLRQLEPGAVQAAATALAELQARFVVYKNASRGAKAHAATAAKSLAPSLTTRLNQAHGQLDELLLELRTGAISQGKCHPQQALELLQELDTRQQNVLTDQQQYLTAAAMIHDDGVAKAAKGLLETSHMLTQHLAVLSAFRSAQLRWSRQVDVLYSTPAINGNCKEMLQQLEVTGAALWRQVVQLEVRGSVVVRQMQQAYQPGDNALLHAATTIQEAGLAATSRLDLSAWQSRTPLGLFLTADAVKSKHFLMLLHLMALSEPAGESGSSLNGPAAERVDGVLGDFQAASGRACAALLQYELVLRDAYQQVFLPNAAASLAGSGRAGCTNSFRTASCCQHGKQSEAGRFGPSFGSPEAVAAVSLGALLAWLGRSAQTAAVLQQVVDIAEGEQLLEQQLAGVEARLRCLGLQLSDSRVAGCFMVINLDSLRQSLEAAQHQLQSIARQRYHHGVAEQLMDAQILLHNLMEAAKAEQPAPHTAPSEAAEDLHQGSEPRGRSTYSLLQHADMLAMAAQATLNCISKARSAAAAQLLPELHARWPRLGLVPAEALLQLLEQLPTYFRASASRDPVQLPIQLLEILFKGVQCLTAVALPRCEQLTASCQQQDDEGQQDTSPAAQLQDRTMSGCRHEPLSTAETAALADAGGLCITALSTSLHGRRYMARDSRASAQHVYESCCGTELTLEASSTLANHVATWAGSCCGQALLLADSVLWTQAAAASLQQQASGNSRALQALADSAVLQLETITGALRQCREVAAELCAAGVTGPTDFEWGKQLRFYWQPETSHLQVCFGSCQLPYGWEYAPANLQSFISMPNSSLLSAAAAALQSSPIVGLDCTSVACTSSGSTYKPKHVPTAIGVRPSVAAAVDAAASWTGRFSTHLQCSSHMTSWELQTWLAELHTAAKDAAKGQYLGMLAGITGLQYLSPAALAACSQAFQDICRQVQVGGSGGAGAGKHSYSSADVPVAIMVEVPACSVAVAGASAGRGTAGQASRRLAVLGAVQLCGRTMALQAPSLVVLLECQLRQFGFVDCRAAGQLLAELLQHVADQPQASAIGGSVPQDANSSLQGRVGLMDVQKVLRWLSGLQRQQISMQQTYPTDDHLQPGSSAMGVLRRVVAGCLLPQLATQLHGTVLAKLQEGLRLATQAAVLVPAAGTAVCTAAVSPELVQLLPVVAVRPPGVLDTKGHLLEQMQACFSPMPVLPQSPHCTGWQAATVAAGAAPGTITHSSSSIHNGESMQESQNQGISSASVHSLNQCGGSQVTTVAVSCQELKSLATLLGDVVGAALSLHSTPSPTHDKWRFVTETAKDAPASDIWRSSCSQGGAAWEDSMAVHACCRDIIAVAGAMWQSSYPCQGSQDCSFIREGNSAGMSAAWTSMQMQWPHHHHHHHPQQQTPTEQFAARLLVFCAAWVLAGRSVIPAGGLISLQQAFQAVLTGAGYSWALPDAGTTSAGQLFSMRPDLATGQWVPWAADAAALSSRNCGCTASAAENGVAAASMGPGGSSSACCGCLASPRACALQYLTWWITKAGRNVLLLGPLGSGIAAAVNQLISCLTLDAALEPSDLSEEDGDVYASDVQGATAGDCAGTMGGSRGNRNSSRRWLTNGSSWLPLTPGLTPGQLGHVLLRHVQQQQQAGTPGTTEQAAGSYSCWFRGHSVPFSSQLWLYDEDFAVPGSDDDCSGPVCGSSEWLRQLLETRHACSAGEGRGRGPVADISGTATPGALGTTPSCFFSLVDRKQVLAAVVAEYQEQLPRVQNVAKVKLLEAVIAIFDGVTVALQQLHHWGELPACSIHCFGMQGCRQVLQDVLRLCAADRSELDMAVSEEQSADCDGITNMLWNGMTLAEKATAAAGGGGGGGGGGASLWSQRIQLKSIVFAMLEGLCRRFDGIPSAVAARALQRVIALLVLHHLAFLDQHSSEDPPQAAEADNIEANMKTAARGSTRNSIPAADSQPENSNSNILQQVLHHLARTGCSSDLAGGNAPGCAVWQDLQQMSDLCFVEAVRSALLPRVVPGRMVSQMLALSSNGADPVLCLEPLHIPAAQAELQQLLWQQAAGQFGPSGPLQTSGQQKLCWDGTGSSLQTCMAPAEVACAARLLRCSTFVTAAHKLMWWLQHAQQRQVLQPGEGCAADVDPAMVLLAGHNNMAMRAVAATAAAALAAAWVHVPASNPHLADLMVAAAIQSAIVHFNKSLTAEQVDSRVEADGAHKDCQQQQLLCVLLSLPSQRMPAQEILQLLKRRGSAAHAAMNSTGAAPTSHQTNMSSSGTSQLRISAPPVCFVVIGTPEQVQYVLAEAPSLQQHCLQLCVPSLQLGEALAADCREQLLSTCGSHLADHIKAEKLQQQWQEQHQAGSHSLRSSAKGDSDSRDASALASATRHMAESLAAAISSVHCTVHKACSRTNLERTTAVADIMAASPAQACLQQHPSAQERCGSKSSQASQCDSNIDGLAGYCEQPLPMWKPFDVLQLLPVLLKKGQQPLITRRALLTRCLATMEHTRELVLQQLQQQGKSNTLLVTETQCQAEGNDVGHEAASGDSGLVGNLEGHMAALQKLLHGLQRLQTKWTAELHQVIAALPAVLPDALLAAVDLVYLGALPLHQQQQDSVIIQKLNLLQPGTPVWSAAQLGAAAATLGMASGVLVLVIEPWQLLPPLLSSIMHKNSSSSMAADDQWVTISPAELCFAAYKTACSAYESEPVHNGSGVPANQQLHEGCKAFDTGRGMLDSTLREISKALLAGHSVCLRMRSCSNALEIQLLEAVVSMYGCMLTAHTFPGVGAAQNAQSSSTGVEAAGAGEWQQKRRFRHNSIATGGGRGAAAASLPSLIVHVGSRCCSLKADIFGSFQVVDLAGLRGINCQHRQPAGKSLDADADAGAAVTAAGPNPLQQPALEAQPLLQLALVEQVQRLLLAASDAGAVEDVARAAAKAEASQQQVEWQEAQLIRHLSQDLGPSQLTRRLSRVLGFGQWKQQHHGHPQSKGLALAHVLRVVPAAVPIAVYASTAAAALAVVYEAAAAADILADSVSVWSVGVGRIISRCDGRTGQDHSMPGGCAASSTRHTNWEVILLSAEGDPVVAEALALLDLLQASRCSKQAGQQAAQPGVRTDRIWLAAPHQLKETVVAASGHLCFSFNCDDQFLSARRLNGPAVAAKVMSLMLQAQATSCSGATAAAAGALLPVKGCTTSSCRTHSTDTPKRSLVDSSLLAVLQPLMVAAAAAYAKVQQQQGGRPHAADVCNLLSPWDVRHLLVLLHNVSQAALAAAEGSTGDSCRGHSSSRNQLLLPCQPVPHGTHLSLDLQQLQKMLQWAVFGPASCSVGGGICEALLSALSPASLAVRARGVQALRSTEGGVVVQGGAGGFGKVEH
eukprot:gene6043-6281_t